MIDKTSMFPNERLRCEVADIDQMLASDAPDLFQSIICANAAQTSTQCNSAIGIAVSLIDGMIATSRVLFMMDLSSPEIQEALKDLSHVHELRMLLTSEAAAPQGRIHSAMNSGD